MAGQSNIFRGIGRAMGGKTLGTAFMLGTYAMTAIPTYKESRERGDNAAVAGAKAVTQAVLWNDFMMPMLALTVAPMVPMVNQQYRNAVGNLQKKITPFSPWNDGAADTEQAQTSRARSVEAIQNSRMNARSYIGNEAGLFSTRYH